MLTDKVKIPAGGIAATVTNQDFGTSRWQLADTLRVHNASLYL
jgi:hypothetical protein